MNHQVIRLTCKVSTSTSNHNMSRQHHSNIICYIILYNNKILKWFISLIWYSFKISFSPLCSMRWIKLYLTCICILKKIKLTHHCFKSSLSICNNWIDRVSFLYFLAQQDSCQPNWYRLLPFPFRCRLSFGWRRYTVSCFLSIEPRWACCLHFIFQQCFVQSPPLSSRNWSIEFVPPPSVILLGPSDSHPPLL
jgi:hypothetical protein